MATSQPVGDNARKGAVKKCTQRQGKLQARRPGRSATNARAMQENDSGLTNPAGASGTTSSTSHSESRPNPGASSK